MQPRSSQFAPAARSRAGGIERLGFVVAAGALVLLAAAVALGLDLSAAMREQQRWVRHTVDVQFQAERVMGALSELGRRVLFALSSAAPIDPAAFERADAMLEAELAQLRGLIADNPPQSRQARMLTDLSRTHVEALRELNALPVSALGDRMKGWRERIDGIQGAIAVFVADESELLAERQRAFDEALQRQTLLMVVMVTLAGLAVVWALWATVRFARQRADALAEAQRHATQVTTLNAELEQRVLQRTDALEQLGRVQRLRNDLARVLLAALDEPDTAPMVERWRQRVLASGTVDWVDVRLTGAGDGGTPLEPLHDGATTLPLAPDHGVVRFRLSAAGRSAQGVGARAANVAEDLAAWLELRRQRAARAAAERERDERDAQLTALFDQTPVGLTLFDPQLRIVRINDAAAAIGGHRPQQIVGLRLQELPQAEYAAPLWPMTKQVRDSGEPAVNRRIQMPLGSQRWEIGTLLVSLVPLKRADGERIGFAAMTMDITAAERSRQRLHELARQLLYAEEKERRSLAREMHDDFGQRLTAIKLNLQLARRATAEAPTARALDEAVAIADGCIDQVRRRVVSLRPPQLDELGLAAALRAHAEQEAARAQIDVRVEVELGGGEPSPEWAGHTFRIAQEALRNAIEHGNPEIVTVALRRNTDGVVLAVTDNGVGVGEAAGRAGTGIMSMRERAELLGGTFRLAAVQPHGTMIECRWPAAAVFPAADG